MSNKTYKINKMKQLIDLNGEYKNFEVSFSAQTKDNSVFDVVVVNQDTLDNGLPLVYKKADNGFISGNFRSDENHVFKNYFLVLKCEKPTECVVSITSKHVDMKKPQPQQQQPQQQQPRQQQPQQQQPQQQQPQQQAQQPTSIVKNIKDNWKLILGICIICFVIYYYFYSNSKDESVSTNLIENKIEKGETKNLIGSPTPSSIMSYSSNNSESGDDDILNFF